MARSMTFGPGPVPGGFLNQIERMADKPDMDSFTEWQSHFNIPSDAWDSFRQTLDSAATEDVGPNSLAFVIWCIENGHLSESQFTSWLAELSELPVVRNEYFEIPVDLPFWERVRDVAAWTPERLPLADWDGILAVGSLWPPISTAFVNQPVSVVLCPPRGLMFLANQLGLLSRTEAVESAKQTPELEKPEIKASAPELENTGTVDPVFSAPEPAPSGAGEDFFAKLERSMSTDGVQFGAGSESVTSSEHESSVSEDTVDDFALPDGLSLNAEDLKDLKASMAPSADANSDLSAIGPAHGTVVHNFESGENEVLEKKPVPEVAATIAVKLETVEPAPESEPEVKPEPTPEVSAAPVFAPLEARTEPIALSAPPPPIAVPPAKEEQPEPVAKSDLLKRSDSKSITDRFKITPPPMAVPPPPPIPQPADQMAAQTAAAEPVKKQSRRFEAPAVTSFFGVMTNGGKSPAMGGAAVEVAKSQEELVKLKAIPLSQLETRHIDESRSIDEAGSQSLAQVSNIFEVSMILLFRDGSLLPWKWSDLFLSVKGDRPDAIDLDDASIFKIVFKTGKPYHGYVVTNPVNQKFFNEFYRGMLPKHATIVPVMVDSRMAGMILGFTNSKVDYRQSLRLMERLSFDLGRVFTKLRSGMAKSA